VIDGDAVIHVLVLPMTAGFAWFTPAWQETWAPCTTTDGRVFSPV
jgi:hypothetical protein